MNETQIIKKAKKNTKTVCHEHTWCVCQPRNPWLTPAMAYCGSCSNELSWRVPAPKPAVPAPHAPSHHSGGPTGTTR